MNVNSGSSNSNTKPRPKELLQPHLSVIELAHHPLSKSYIMRPCIMRQFRLLYQLQQTGKHIHTLKRLILQT